MPEQKDTEFVIICDGLRVGRAPTKTKAENLANAMSKRYPPHMIFSVSEDTKAKGPHITASQKQSTRKRKA